MSDDTYHQPTSPASSVYSLHLDYEMSQQDQEIREAREAEMTTEELEAAARVRHLKRVRKGYSPASSPIKQEDSLPRSDSPPPRSTALAAHITVGQWFESGDFLDSQTGDGTYVDNLCNTGEESQQAGEGKASQVEEAEPTDEDFELEVQIKRLRSRLEFVLKEKDDLEWQQDKYRRAYQEADAGRNQALEKLRQWQEAAAGASPLLKLALDFVQ
ncbi:hypothetical protein DFH07DRAFT_777056 [Mycena maculata]|uniref:Uncharacterized protein n=1 Tax=Mycena maculata TaxID=230809 RepID=A0AAD7N3V7_9AGAR|nr:hypothetical protein DFH07DRAFT_777056 [Mycena maculata]